MDVLRLMLMWVCLPMYIESTAWVPSSSSKCSYSSSQYTEVLQSRFPARNRATESMSSTRDEGSMSAFWRGPMHHNEFGRARGGALNSYGLVVERGEMCSAMYAYSSMHSFGLISSAVVSIFLHLCSVLICKSETDALATIDFLFLSI
jgi:hypothetical protein